MGLLILVGLPACAASHSCSACVAAVPILVRCEAISLIDLHRFGGSEGLKKYLHTNAAYKLPSVAQAAVEYKRRQCSTSGGSAVQAEAVVEERM